MKIVELIEQLKAMPEKMEGYNAEGELVVLNTRKLANALDEPLRNCDVGNAESQLSRHSKWCAKSKDFSCAPSMCRKCYADWSQMTYVEGETDGQK